MKMYLLWIYWLIVVMTFHRCIKAGDGVCEDTGRCTNVNCKAPGIADYCKKTCGLCAGQGECRSAQTKQSDGTCSCPRGKWGPSCSKTCSKGCQNDKCVEETGSCLSGCKMCYTGIECVVSPRCVCDINSTCTCNSGFYGTSCLSKCNTRCKEKSCDLDGSCSHGCTAGWYGDKCNKHCSHCANDACFSNNGTCTKGCKEGYHAPECNSTCSDNCADKSCNQTDGGCYRGCIQGWFGDRCDKPCSVNCVSESCDRSDGSCSSCKSGFTGHHCNISCPNNCAGSSCRQHDGSCHGCKDGYRGSLCGDTCPRYCRVCDKYGERCSSCNPGWYGQLCEKSCQNCIAGICNITDGYCVDGCKVGFYNKFCSKSCSDHCFEKRCHTTNNSHIDPACTEGCKDGWWGDYCDDQCPQYCLKCARSDGECLECEGTKYGTNCKKGTNGAILWTILPSFLIISLLAVTFLVLKGKKPMKPRIVSPMENGISMLQLVKPSNMDTPRGVTEY